MLWIKAFHLIAVVAWFAGLFYLPRLFVYHAGADDAISQARFRVMEYKLYYAITWPAGIVTTGLGLGLLLYAPSYYLHAAWIHVKLTLVILLWLYHLSCGYFLAQFAAEANRRTARFFRFFNEIPTLLLVGIVIAVVVKP